MVSSNVPESAVSLNTSGIYTYKKFNVDKLKHEYEITVRGSYIEQKMNSKLREIAKNAKMPGFRSGKTPYDLVVKNYKNEVLGYIVNNTIDYCSDDLMKKFEVKSRVSPKVDIISLPDLDKKDERSDFVYKLSFELMPEVPMIDLDKINLKKIEVKIEERDVKEFIDSMRIKFPNFVSVDDDSYQAKEGDRIVIDFEGRIRNKLFQGGSAKNFAVNLGSHTFIDGFEDQLIGIKKGEIKNLKLKFPDNYQIISLAGQEATFFVRVHDVQIVKDFENDDEAAKKIGFKNYSLLVDYAREMINNQCKKMGSFLIKKELFDYLDASYSFDLPTDIVKQEQQRVEQESISEVDPFKEAEKRVKLAMLFMKFSTEHKISLTKDDILNVILNQYVSRDLPLNKALKRFSSNRQFQELVRGQALEHKVTDYVIEKVNKEKQIVSVKKLKELFDDI
ncbi:MAG: trigger factor [Wolbachia endosymbiont of Meromenopon meropis]|nr:trigger factor [Wolbachia endosymbiont of Meromenopon meropis]